MFSALKTTSVYSLLNDFPIPLSPENLCRHKNHFFKIIFATHHPYTKKKRP